MELEIDKKGKVFVRIDRKRKLPVTVLLRAMGYEPDQEILDLFDNSLYMRNTVEADTEVTRTPAYTATPDRHDVGTLEALGQAEEPERDGSAGAQPGQHRREAVGRLPQGVGKAEQHLVIVGAALEPQQQRRRHLRRTTVDHASAHVDGVTRHVLLLRRVTSHNSSGSTARMRATRWSIIARPRMSSISLEPTCGPRSVA